MHQTDQQAVRGYGPLRHTVHHEHVTHLRREVLLSTPPTHFYHLLLLLRRLRQHLSPQHGRGLLIRDELLRIVTEQNRPLARHLVQQHPRNLHSHFSIAGEQTW